MSRQGLESTEDRPAVRQESAPDAERPALSGEIARSLKTKPFRPHPLFRNGHAQTLAAFVWPRRSRLQSAQSADEARLFEVEDGVSLLAHCRWQRDHLAHPTMVLVHGLEGSSESIYMLGTADKAFRAGFNVLRTNMRNCGGTEHLTPTLYNSGMSGDFRAVLRELIERDRLPSIFLVGFSMGGNVVLKLAGEDGTDAPEELAGVCAVSPALDLGACADRIEHRSNWLYQKRFINSLHRRMHTKRKLHPDLYDISDLHMVRTIRDFDERFTAVHGGYESAVDYYQRASALQFVHRISRPTLILHAQDDPFVPFQSFRHPSITDNSHVTLLAPRHGGHVGFIAEDGSRRDEDRFWGENRIVEFCLLVHRGACRA